MIQVVRSLRACAQTMRVMPRACASVTPGMMAVQHPAHRTFGTSTRRLISFKSFLGSNNDGKEETQAQAEEGKQSATGEQQQGKQDEQSSQEAQAKGQDNQDPKVAELQEQLQKAQEEAKDVKEKYLRSLAEMENVRERAKHQVEDAKHYGIQKFAKDMLEIADVLELALDNVPEDSKKHGDAQALKDLFEGLETTNKLLHRIFERHHLHTIKPVGEKFDPNHHEALFEVPRSENAEGGTVAVVTKAGYSLSGRTIRPASVGVVSK